MGLSSVSHWLIVLLIVVLVFGTAKLRNIGRDLGGAVHDFKEGLNQDKHRDVGLRRRAHVVECVQEAEAVLQR